MRKSLGRWARGVKLQSVAFGGVVAAAVALTGCEGGCRKSPAPTQQDPPKPATSSKEPAPSANPNSERPTTPTPSAGAGTAPATTAPPATAKATPVIEPKTTLPKEDPEIDRVCRDLIKRWDSVPAFSADVETNMARAFDGPGSTSGKGRYDLQKQPGGNPLIHYAMRNGIAFKINDEDYVAPELIHWVADGKFLFQLTKQPDVFRVDKRHYDPSLILQVGGRDLLERLREENVLLLREETQVDGRDAYVIDAVAKDGGNRSVHTFDKVTGARLLWQELGTDPKPVFSVKLFNLSLTPGFPEDHFTLVVPDGATLNDETK